jgi:hypothetical protein
VELEERIAPRHHHGGTNRCYHYTR